MSFRTGGFMNYINNIYLLGNLTRDPEIKYTNEGTAITEMGLASNKKWTDKNGKDLEAVDYFNITVWGNLAENCASALKKGNRIMVCGHLNLRSWENKEGKKYNITSITADVVAASLEFNHIKILDKDSIKKEGVYVKKDKIKSKET
jgi:single-strand DNA-binding protein